MKRIFIIHCWGGSSKNDWLPWSKSELEGLGYDVIAPDMPETDEPEIDKWVGKLSELVAVPDSETFFIGHSIGCQTILRYLETIDVSVGGAVFVAGWFNLENLEDDDAKAVAAPWLETPINAEKVRAVLPRSTLIISDNDPYGAFEENTEKFTELGSAITLLHDAGHITEDDGFLELPELITEFKKLN